MSNPFCSECGTEAQVGASFCTKCGKKVGQKSKNQDAKHGVNGGDDAPISAKSQNKSRVHPIIFYGALGLVTLGAASAILLPIFAGYPPGKDATSTCFLAAICVYLILRRFGRGRVFALGISLLALVITGFLIGFLDAQVNGMRNSIDRELSKNPVALAIKQNDPKAYQQLMIRTAEVYRQSKDEKTYRSYLMAEFFSLYGSYVRKASDTAIIAMYRAQLNTTKALQRTSPEQCYRYANGDNVGALKNEDILFAMANIVRSGAGQREHSIDKIRLDQSTDRAIENAQKKLGRKLNVLDLLGDPKGEFAAACQASIAVMEEILNLPSIDSANFARDSMLSK